MTKKIDFTQLSVEEQAEFKKMLKEASDLFFQIESSKMSVKDIAERAKDELGVPTSEFNRYAKIAFDNQKARDQLEDAELVYNNAVQLNLIEDD